MQQGSSILYQPIEELLISVEFKSTLINSGFTNLNEVLKLDANTLRLQKGFNYHNITELINVLNRNGLERLLKE